MESGTSLGLSFGVEGIGRGFSGLGLDAFAHGQAKAVTSLTFHQGQPLPACPGSFMQDGNVKPP